MRHVGVRVVEDAERLERLGPDLEVGAVLVVADADLQLVGVWLPEERDLETVVRAVGQLSKWAVAELRDCHLRLLVVFLETPTIAAENAHVSVASYQSKAPARAPITSEASPQHGPMKIRSSCLQR